MSFWDNLKDSLGGIGDLTSTLFNPIGSVANVWATVEGVKQNKEINDLNYQLQKDNLAYQKDLQKIMFAREDNAVRRRVSDLRKAGLSPVLAAGSSASAGPVVSTSAPQRASDLNGYLALAQVGTMLAQQQKAQTEADIARQHLKQSKIDTKNAELDNKFFTDKGVAPVEVNQDWKTRLVNLLYPKLEDAFFGEDSKSGLFGTILELLKRDLNDPPDTGVHVGEDGRVYNSAGNSISSGQASLLKQKSLYLEWVYNGFTENVVKALGLGSRNK